MSADSNSRLTEQNDRQRKFTYSPILGGIMIPSINNKGANLDSYINSCFLAMLTFLLIFVLEVDKLHQANLKMSAVKILTERDRQYEWFWVAGLVSGGLYLLLVKCQYC